MGAWFAGPVVAEADRDQPERLGRTVLLGPGIVPARAYTERADYGRVALERQPYALDAERFLAEVLS